MDYDLAAHLDAIDRHDRECNQLDQLVIGILRDAPAGFDDADDRAEWISDVLTANGLDDWRRSYVRQELEENLP